MMLPLWTSVRFGLRYWMAYSMAARTRRSVPSREIGLTPMPVVSGKRIELTPISSCRKLMSFLASADSALNSMPA